MSTASLTATAWMCLGYAHVQAMYMQIYVAVREARSRRCKGIGARGHGEGIPIGARAGTMTGGEELRTDRGVGGNVGPSIPVC